MIDVFSLLVGMVLGVVLTAAGLVLGLRQHFRRDKPTAPAPFMTHAEVQRQVREAIDASSAQGIANWTEKKTETKRLTGKGVA